MAFPSYLLNLVDIHNIDQTLLLRTTLELILAFLALKYITSKNVKDSAPKIELSKKVPFSLLIIQEIEELIDEWTPDPLVPEQAQADESLYQQLKKGSIDFCSIDYHGLVGNQKIMVRIVSYF